MSFPPISSYDFNESNKESIRSLGILLNSLVSTTDEFISNLCIPALAKSVRSLEIRKFSTPVDKPLAAFPKNELFVSDEIAFSTISFIIASLPCAASSPICVAAPQAFCLSNPVL